MTRRIRKLALLGLAVVVLTGFAPPAPNTLNVTAPSSDAPIGGANFYFCAMAQTVKIFGLFTANVPMVVGGAIAGGVACGMGW